MTSVLTRDDREGWSILTLNRPDKLNALNVEIFTELRRHLVAIREEEGVRCLVLRGAGRCFSAGHDLEAIAEGEPTPSPGWHSETLRMMELMPIRVIAAVHGHCYTGALEVALACDFILAAENALFADTHARWALTPIWGMSQRLPRLVGAAMAKRLMFTCETLDAFAAERAGLVQQVVAVEKFDDSIVSLAQRIVANSSFSHRANKRLLEAADGWPLDAGLQWEIHHNEGLGPDAEERLASFASARRSG